MLISEESEHLEPIGLPAVLKLYMRQKIQISEVSEQLCRTLTVQNITKKSDYLTIKFHQENSKTVEVLIRA